MKPRHTQATRLNAREVLRAANIALGQDFFTLRRSQVELLLKEADRTRYRISPAANGSRGRYFHEFLQRQAR